MARGVYGGFAGVLQNDVVERGVDKTGASVAEKQLQPHGALETGAADDTQREIGDADGVVGRDGFDDGRLRAEGRALFGVADPVAGEAVEQAVGDEQQLFDLAELEADGGQLADRFAEASGNACGGETDSFVAGGTGDAGVDGGERDGAPWQAERTARVGRADGADIEQGIGGDVGVLQHEVMAAAGAEGHGVPGCFDADSRCIAGNEEGAETRGLVGLLDGGKDEEVAQAGGAGRINLAAIEQPFARGLPAGSGVGETTVARAAEARLGLGGVEHGALFDDLAAEGGQAVGPEVALDKDAEVAEVHAEREGRGGVAPRNALKGEGEVELIRTEAAVLYGYGEGEEAGFAEIGEVLEREAGVAVVLLGPLGEAAGEG